MGQVEVGGAGTVGIAFETVLGTYMAPTKWIPVRSETLDNLEDKVWRKNIRGVADISGAIQGYRHVAGDIVFEVSNDVLVYFLYASRTLPSRTGVGAPFAYVFTPVHVAKATTDVGLTTRKTLSILTTRSGNPMAYLGLSVGQLVFSLDGGVLVCTASMVGTSQEDESDEIPSYTTNDPFGPGEITLEIPTSTPRVDVDTVSLTINDNLVPANRLNGSRYAAYQNWGERETTLTAEHDFENEDDYNIFLDQDIQPIKLVADDGDAESLEFLLNAAVEENYKINLAGLGEVNKASLNYHAIYDTDDAYQITVNTSEDVGAGGS